MRMTDKRKAVPARRHVNDVKRLVRSNVANARVRWSNLGGTTVSLLKELTTNYRLCVELGDLILLEGRWYLTRSGQELDPTGSGLPEPHEQLLANSTLFANS